MAAEVRTPKLSVKYNVRYRGGAKPFPKLSEARAFAKMQREPEEGWAEVTRITTEIVDRKR
jgi:hypothetical protein